jgi:hypothetical protein
MENRNIKNEVLMVLLASTLSGAVAIFMTPEARADQGPFSLSGGSGLSPGAYGIAKTTDMLSTPATSQYENGSWAFKLTAPYSGTPTTGGPEIGHDIATSTADNTHFGPVDSEAAATYNINRGVASTFGVNLTGKIKLNLADTFPGSSPGLNDYAAQAEAYRNLDRFQALGTLGYRIHSGEPGININKVFYGSVGGIYRLSDQMSGGIDFRLSQSPASPAQGQRQVSAYVSHNINNNFKARGYLLQDFSNGNPERTVGAAASYGF